MTVLGTSGLDTVCFTCRHHTRGFAPKGTSTTEPSGASLWSDSSLPLFGFRQLNGLAGTLWRARVYIDVLVFWFGLSTRQYQNYVFCACICLPSHRKRPANLSDR